MQTNYEELRAKIENLEFKLPDFGNDQPIPDIETFKIMAERLKESEKINRALLENSPVCTKIVDKDLNLQYMSEAGIQALKLTNITDYYGKPYPLQFYSKSFKDPMLIDLENAKETGEICRHEAPILDADGKEIWFYSSVVPVKTEDGDLDYLMVVSVDITKRIEALEEVKNYQNNLEKKVEERTLELEEKNKDLERFNNLFQGREFRIKELRDQVKSLKEKLSEMERH